MWARTFGREVLSWLEIMALSSMAGVVTSLAMNPFLVLNTRMAIEKNNSSQSKEGILSLAS